MPRRGGRQRCLRFRISATIGRPRGPAPGRALCCARLARTQSRRPPLLDGPGIATYRGEIPGHDGRFLDPGGIMLPKEPGIGLPEFPWAAVARITSVGKDLRGRFAGVEIRLSLQRERSRRSGGADHPRHNSTDPRHPYPPLRPTATIAPIFGQKRDASFPACPLNHAQLLQPMRVAVASGLCFNSAGREGRRP